MAERTNAEWEAIYAHGCDLIAERDERIAALERERDGLRLAIRQVISQYFSAKANTNSFTWDTSTSVLQDALRGEGGRGRDEDAIEAAENATWD